MKLVKTAKKAKRVATSTELGITKESLSETIWRHHGILTLICAELDITYPQLWNQMRKFDLVGDLKRAKETFVSEAEATIYESLKSKSEAARLKAADLVMKYSTPKTEQTTISVKNGDCITEIRKVFGLEDVSEGEGVRQEAPVNDIGESEDE